MRVKADKWGFLKGRMIGVAPCDVHLMQRVRGSYQVWRHPGMRGQGVHADNFTLAYDFVEVVEDRDETSPRV